MKSLIAALVLVLLVVGITLKKPWSKSVFRVHPNPAVVTPLPEPKSQNTVHFQVQSPEAVSQGYQLQIFLLGAPTQLIDAADLAVEAGPNLRLVSAQPGETFPQYPRMSIESTRAVFTGVAGLMSGNQKDYGQPNRVFVSLVVEKIDPALPATLLINTTDTKAYFNGEPILNKKQSLQKISL